jgi:hypothetical protein
MAESSPDLWRGLSDVARAALQTRDYSGGSLGERLQQTGRVDARELVGGIPAEVGIPGVEVFHRRVFHQRYRGYFSEFAREGEALLGKIGLWPEAWFQRLFVEEPTNYSLRPYDKEQWDVMFFIQGICEMFLIDERAGMPRKKMRFIIEGDDLRSESNVGVVIPAGVAHAIRSASSQDLIMVYGTSTVFLPENEGRIEHGIETPETPADWEKFWNLA